jgi:hypothetical protein
MANAGITLWLLFSQSLGTFFVAKTLVSWALTGGAALFSAWWFHHSMRRHGIIAPRVARVPLRNRLRIARARADA